MQITRILSLTVRLSTTIEPRYGSITLSQSAKNANRSPFATTIEQRHHHQHREKYQLNRGNSYSGMWLKGLARCSWQKGSLLTVQISVSYELKSGQLLCVKLDVPWRNVQA